MILRACIVIPAFDNPNTVVDVIERCLVSTDIPVLIWDDGSKIPVKELFQNSKFNSSKYTQRLFFRRFEKNQGKGAALVAAMKECIQSGYTHMLTVDADGQHYPEEVHKLLDAAKSKPWNLIIGSRLMDTSAPGISHFGRKFSNFWVKYQSDFCVSDSQSGFRVYPLFLLQTMKFFTRRFDFEIEVLVRVLWRNIEVSGVDVKVLYQPAGVRVSHFDKLWDNVRITLLNTVFIIFSLLRRHTEPRASGIAVGMGIFIGCTPFYGFHTLIVAAVSFFFKLNAVLLWAGSNISIPPIAPVLIFFSLQVGAFLFGISLEIPTDLSIANYFDFAIQMFWTWLVGSLFVGIVFGSLGGIIVYLFTKRFQQKNNVRNWTGAARGGRLGNGFMFLVLKYLGLKAGYFCLHFVYPYFYLFAPKARRALNEYWAILQPELSWINRQWKIVGHFRIFSFVLIDKIYQNMQGQNMHEKIIFKPVSDGFEIISKALESNNGLLLLGAHIGNADLAAASFHTHRVHRKINILQFESKEITLNKVFGGKNSEHVHVIYVNDEIPVVYQVHGLLSKGEMIGLLADRPLDNNFELLPFFGKLAPIATSPFRIALATGAQVVMTCGFKARNKSYDYFARPILCPKAKTVQDREIAAYEMAATYACELESFLKKYPDQWFNFYSFFSAIPTLPTGGRCKPKQYHWREELGEVQTVGLLKESASNKIFV